MKILLIWPPFSSPASPPYSIASLYSLLKTNSDYDIEVLDLNLEFHKRLFLEFQKFFQNPTKDYKKIAKEYSKFTTKLYSENNKRVINNKNPDLTEEFLQLINNKNPDLIAFSVVYSSQVFYSYALIKQLKQKVIIGGPAVNNKLKSIAKYLKSPSELVKEIKPFIPEFNIFHLNEYFTEKPVIPIKTTSCCYYKQCSFCTHYKEDTYHEIPLEQIKQTIINSKQKYFFFIDDTINKDRLLKLSSILKPLKVKWCCQLRPIKDFDYATLKELNDSGLDLVLWGVESASNRILNLMKKGTNISDIEQVLKDSKKAKIKNALFMIFGFPTETIQELKSTIDFLRKNKEYIDIIETSTFGLQKESKIYNNPEEYSIIEITKKERTILEPRITYKVSEGLSQEQANKLRRNFQKRIDKLNKYPKEMNFFREHLLIAP